MVPGSTLRYGSSFWRETARPRAFRMFPIEAAVMPLPSELTTPPVTKTYLDKTGPPAVFAMLPVTGVAANLDFRPPAGSVTHIPGHRPIQAWWLVDIPGDSRGLHAQRSWAR